MMEPDELGLEYEREAIETGAILANRDITAFLDREGNLLHAWSASDGLPFCGPVRFRFTSLRQVRGQVVPEELVPLEIGFYPTHQERILGSEELILTLRTFVPLDAGYERAVCWLIEVQSEGPRLLEIELDARFVVEGVGPLEARRVELELDVGQVVATTVPVELPRFGMTVGSTNEVRILGTPSGPPDQAILTHPARARLTYRLLVEGTVELPFLLTYAPSGVQLAWNGWLSLNELERFWEGSQRTARERLRIAELWTPDPQANRTLAWAALMAWRAQQEIGGGPGVATRPGQPLLDVTEQCWYAMAADTFDPTFAGALLARLAAEAQTDDGTLGGTLAALRGTTESSGVTVSVATPLFVLAAAHHWAMTADRPWLDSIWPAVRSATEALMTARRGGDLLVVEANGTGHSAIGGWRREIPGEQLVGPVTEVNALAALALDSASTLASITGDTNTAIVWREAAVTIRTAMLRDLRRPGGELLVLTTAQAEGADPRDELTGDLVFPLLALHGTDPALAERLSARLHSPYQWGPSGARTVGSDQPSYDPAFAEGMMGGFSPMLTAWVGMATGAPLPALDALAPLLSPTAPATQGLIPGQLPAALHGEQMTRLGEPWHPLAAPLLRWMVLGPLVQAIPLPAPRFEPWPWFFASAIPWRGGAVSALLLDGTWHTEFASPIAAEERWERITRLKRYAFPAFLLERGPEQALMVAAPERALRETVDAGGHSWQIELEVGAAVLLHSPSA